MPALHVLGNRDDRSARTLRSSKDRLASISSSRGGSNRCATTRVVAYRLPNETFERDPEVGGYWLSREPVVPVELVELGDLVELHARSRIDLRVVENLWPTWRRVVASSLEYSGIRLHNALPAADEP